MVVAGSPKLYAILVRVHVTLLRSDQTSNPGESLTFGMSLIAKGRGIDGILANDMLIEVPDISVKMCTTFPGDLGESKSGYPGAIIATLLASEAAFVIEHPEKAKDVDAVYFAGVHGALHSYEAIRSKDASYVSPHLDDLIQKRDQGKLADYVHATARSASRLRS